MGALLEIPDRSVAMLGEKLRAVKTVIDLDHGVEGDAPEEVARLRRMKTLLVRKKNSQVVSAIAVRRAVSVLAQVDMPEAVGLLEELAGNASSKDVARLAAAALGRLRTTSGGKR
jgi:HEAT repeat protein